MCKENLVNSVYDNSNDEYELFESLFKKNFEKAISQNKKLFKTNAENLFETYLSQMPKDAQQHYTCNACKHFIERFGDLVFVDEDGSIKSAMWDMNEVPKFFKKSVKAMEIEVLASKVTGVFIPEQLTLGIPKTGEWTHISVKLPKEMKHTNALLTPYQVMAEKTQDFKMLINALLEFDIETVNKAVTLLKSETLYRSDKVLGVAQFFKELHDRRNAIKNSKEKANITWLAVANAPTGFCHIKSSMIGTLLDDIQSGMSIQSVSNRFSEKMNPNNYMRSQSAPTANAIVEAEKLVVKLGIAESLQRKYATLNDVVEKLWLSNTHKNLDSFSNVNPLSGGVFGNIAPKGKSKPNNDSTLNLPSKVMTWEKFSKTVLPSAESIEALVDNPNRFMALVTALNEDSPNILQWNNPVSWYYHGGIDGEIKRRVEQAGGRYENNEIRCSLIWENYTDLDLHCITPRGREISFSDKRDNTGGWLDIDMNAGGNDSKEPVENIRWSENAPSGRYKFFVHNFSERDDSYNGTSFKVELEVNGQVYYYDGQPLMHKNKVTVFEFEYVKGHQPVFYNDIHPTSSNGSNWNIESNKFVKVNAVTTSPNLWGEQQIPHHGSHIFFLLDGMKDQSEGKGRGFFNETLKPELREIRKTLESFTANTPIEGVEDATACGVGYSKDSEWNLTLKVKSNGAEQIIKIDRWD